MHILSTDVKLIFLVLSLGIDSFAVAIGLGISGLGKNNRLRVGTSFALFEGTMPLIGFLLGHVMSGLLGEITSVLGLVVLFGIGIWIIKGAITPEKNDTLQIDTWKGLLFTSFSISLDELAVGFSMGTLGLPIVLTAILIAAQAFILTWVGTMLGNTIGEKIANRAELLAGGVLSILALVLFAEKLFHVTS